jgi:hypothetical protein
MAGFWDDGNDPLTPYLGAFGPRRLTGRGRGSPAGLPWQARDASPFTLTRERVADELEGNPQLQRKLDMNTTAEVGTDPLKRRWYQALTIDRAVATGKPLDEVVNNPNYYPSSTTSQTATTGQQPDMSIWEGANPANFATGNASYDPKKGRYVGFAGGPQTTSFGTTDRGSEYGGIEGGTLPYARAMGYQGPERTAIGPTGPRGDDSELMATLSPAEREIYAEYKAREQGRSPATYPRPEGRTMPQPQSLMDMFQPTDPSGAPVDFTRALASRQNSLIGLGLGLMGATRPGLGEALAGFQAGTAADTRQQALRESRDERKQAQSNWERQFARGGESDWARVAREIMPDAKPGSPEYLQGAKQFYASKAEGDWTVQEDPNTGNKYAWNKRTNETKAIPVPGGATAPGNPFQPTGKMSTDEGKTALYADRAATAHADITKYENLNQQPGGTVGGLVQQNLPAGAANVLVSPERGRAMDAQRAFVNALLRRESGAAINAGEFNSYAKEYFPQVGDTADQIEAKRKHRAEVIAGLARESGRGYRPSYQFDAQGNITLGKPTFTGGQGGAAPAETPAPAKPKPTATKTINGKSYSKIDGQWYED